MDAIVTAINNLIDWFSALPEWFFQLLKNLLLSLFDMLFDLVCYVFDELFKAIVLLVQLIPMPDVSFNANQYLAGAPIEFLSMMVAIRMPEAFAIIVTALGIRFALGLIPLIRVGG